MTLGTVVQSDHVFVDQLASLSTVEPQMTLGTVVQSDHVFVDQLASLSTEQTSGSDTPEEIQDSSRDSSDGRTDNSQRASSTGTANHADNYDGPIVTTPSFS